MIYLQDADFTLHQGDALEVLRTLPDESVQMCVTSPPFYGLRDYGTEGQIGLEETPEQWVQKLVEVFREVRRVLRRDGTLWLEVGDSYNSGNSGGLGGSTLGGGQANQAQSNRHAMPAVPGLKHKDLIGAPWLLAFALRADGWYLRSDIVWSRPNPMPESVTDRPTKSHSYVFLLSKSARYFFDQEAVREPQEARPQQRLTSNVDMPLGAARVAAGVQQGNPQGGAHVSRFDVQRETLNCGCLEAGCGGTFHEDECGCACHGVTQKGLGVGRDTRRSGGSIEPLRQGLQVGRNIRSVWSIATQPYPEAHFATYPEELVRRCILAGTSERGSCPECGAPWAREVERSPMEIDRSERTHPLGRTRSSGTMTKPPESQTLGWHPSCEHTQRGGFGRDEMCDYPLEPVPAVVLDPFSGSGTTALVARKHGRKCIAAELSADYCELSARRLQQLSLLSEGA